MYKFNRTGSSVEDAVVNKKMVFERALDTCGIFNSPRKKITLVVVPQIQLSSYVSAVLRRMNSELQGDILIIHPSSNLMSRKLLEYSSRCFGVHLSLFREVNPEYISIFIELLLRNNKEVKNLVVHPFAEGINVELIDFFSKAGLEKPECAVKFVFYSDGSRNNKDSEFDTQRKGKLFKNVAINSQITLCEFGFSSKSDVLNPDISLNIRNLVIGYEWLDLSYRQVDFDFSTTDLIEKNSCVDQITSNSLLVMSRYWGRDPYYFSDEASLISSMVTSINKAAASKANVILRNDNRSSFNSKKLLMTIGQNSAAKTAYFLEDILSCANTKLSEILFEILLQKNEQLFSNIDRFYSFDSSFPLIFMSKSLMALLPSSVTLVVGFDFDAVSLAGVENCHSVMTKRTAVLIKDIISIDLFEIRDNIGIIDKSIFSSHSKISDEIESRMQLNGGFFYLFKKST